MIDNAKFNYSIRVLTTAPDTSTRFASVRLYYQLQVSPAPATVTFGDVPTSHPFLQFVQALVASGIRGAVVAATTARTRRLREGRWRSS
jgi:hypothetical protein